MIQGKEDPGLFPRFTERQISWLYGYGEELRLEPGELLFDERSVVDNFYVVLKGEIRISRLDGGEETSLTVHRAGDFTGGLAVLTGKRSVHRARATEPSRLLKISSEVFRKLAVENPELADVFISALAKRMRETQRAFRQQEKMAALGKLSAGLAHELNNPASAAGRAAGDLREAVLKTQSLALSNDVRFSPTEKENLANMQQEAVQRSEAVATLDPLEQSDKEDDLAVWLEKRGVEDAWELAPALVASGIDAERLEELAADMKDASLVGALEWLGTTLELVELADEVEKSAGRISELVGAMKEYSYMDKASLQEVDIHHGIENTLTILGHKLKKGVELIRDYDRDLPRILARGGELNQVWTNLIDNAVDAMNGEGKLRIRTSLEDDCVLVEIVDSGPGIPREVQNRIFEPFFTTKGVGEGTGLGLDIVRRIVVGRHGGDIQVSSKPGETCLRVRLPLNSGQKDGG